MNGLEIGAALTGLAALVTATFGGLAALRQAGREDAARDRELEEIIRRVLADRGMSRHDDD